GQVGLGGVAARAVVIQLGRSPAGRVLRAGGVQAGQVPDVVAAEVVEQDSFGQPDPPPPARGRPGGLLKVPLPGAVVGLVVAAPDIGPVDQEPPGPGGQVGCPATPGGRHAVVDIRAIGDVG